MSKKKLIEICDFNISISKRLGLNIDAKKVYRSSGLLAHMLKRGHGASVPYIDRLEEIINSPDYVGINPNEEGTSVELVKRFNNNVVVGIKLDSSKDYLYVATMHGITDSVIERYEKSGRLKQM